MRATFSCSCCNCFSFILSWLLPVLALSLFCPAVAIAELTTPLAVSNQSPLVQIHGLPGMGRSSLLSAGDVETQFSIDVSSHFIHEHSGEESLQFDGESYRYALQLSYGLSDRLEIGLEIPYIAHQSGQLDGFIDSWHSFFGLPTNGRETAPSDQLNFAYSQNDRDVLSLREEVDGLGDIRVCVAWQLVKSTALEPTALALRSRLKLPTGDSGKLTGSGSPDFALWLSAGRQRPVAWGNLGLMSSLGLLFVGEGEVLQDQQRHLVGFGGVGVALQPWQRVKFQLQADFHGPFYRGSQLTAVDSASVQLATGGTIMLDGGHELEIAVIEDIAVGTAPDVVFHLAWRKRY